MSTSGVSAPRSRQTQQQQNQDQYTVRSGDNLTTIAKRLGVPLEGLVALANSPSGETARQREEKGTSESLTMLFNLLLFAPGTIVFFAGVIMLTWVLAKFAKRRENKRSRPANADQA